MKAARPHCDAEVIHAPTKCEFCDHYPELQAERVVAGINFTGEQDPNKKPCPAEVRRPLQTINRWGGNIASPADACPKCGNLGRWINMALSCPQHGPF